jgi:hypothetical protein
MKNWKIDQMIQSQSTVLNIDDQRDHHRENDDNPDDDEDELLPAQLAALISR